MCLVCTGNAIKVAVECTCAKSWNALINSPLKEGRGIKRHKRKKNNNRGRENVKGFVRRMKLIREGGVHKVE